MRPAVEAEKVGIPSVAVAVTNFTTVARLAAKAAGLEDLCIAEYPGVVGVHLAEIKNNVKEVLFEQIIDALTKQVKATSTVEEIQGDPQKTVYRGTLEEVNQFFRDKDWTDGLPIIPPTMERVEKFLKFTDRSPNEEIAVLPQANLRAVAGNIAANGVMAGCRPEDMPILIAAVEAVGDEYFNLNNIGTTWGIVPYLLVNGPIIGQLGIECAGQLISRGPNPALGRALGLIIRNIGGYRPGKNYMGTFGYPLSFALAENEKESPWEPFHVEHGFERNVSTVTAGATITWGWPPSPYSTPDKTAAQSSLELLCIELTKKPNLNGLAERGPKALKNMITFLIAPSVAKSIAAAGYSKKDIRKYLYENARVPVGELEWMGKYGHPEALTVRQKVEKGIYPEEYLVEPHERVRILPGLDVVDDIVHIFVCGDPGRNRVMTFWSGYIQPVTKKINLPRNWDEHLIKRKGNPL